MTLEESHFRRAALRRLAAAGLDARALSRLTIAWALDQTMPATPPDPLDAYLDYRLELTPTAPLFVDSWGYPLSAEAINALLR